MFFSQWLLRNSHLVGNKLLVNRQHQLIFPVHHHSITIIKLPNTPDRGKMYFFWKRRTCPCQCGNHLPWHNPDYLSIYLSIYLCIYIYPSIHPSISIYLSIYLSNIIYTYHIYMYIYMFIYICLYPYIPIKRSWSSRPHHLFGGASAHRAARAMIQIACSESSQPTGAISNIMVSQTKNMITYIQCGAPKIANCLTWFITPITMVYGTYNYSYWGL